MIDSEGDSYSVNHCSNVTGVAAKIKSIFTSTTYSSSIEPILSLQNKVHSHIRIRKSTLKGVDWQDSDLQGGSISGSTFIQSVFSKLNMSKFNFNQSTFEGAKFTATDLEGSNLNGSNFEKSHFIKVNMGHVNLNQSDISGALLEEVVLDSANVNQSDFSHSIMKNISFKNGKYQ
ncbi:pentapeptide repeat-containing protein [Piscirickettsia litoralis]|uniref:pentapeptide repeat-containing protein n=1 Tax=Piscirickettsia litoralis TaxID=1891921 RepID=UPI0013017F68|nr:pentapeptide repeat-containing protein [Piscirickettsia litoralis]